ncbi:MAG: DUF4388 domain-containing protein [Desulfuromonadaceae bacterium]
MTRLIIDSGGRLSLPQPVVKTVGQKTLELSSYSEQHLLLTNRREASAVTMAGSLGDIAVADLLSFFNMFRKTGVLSFCFAGGKKELFFQRGEIVFATSSLPEDDLGELLCALGKLERSVLQRMRIPGTASVVLGKLLVEKGVVSAKDLWQAARHQVEVIVYHLFALTQGSYYFQVRELEDEQHVRLSMSTQNLIMEGLRRVDEWTLFMRRVGSEEHVPVPTGKSTDKVPPAAERLFQLLSGEQRYSVRDLLRKAGVGEFEGLRLLYQLLEKGLVRMEEAPVVVAEGELPVGSVSTGFRKTAGIQSGGKRVSAGFAAAVFLRLPGCGFAR